ncbi:MAG: hypothetical protein OXE99_14555 [Cellvibrionales bacterium]|nr:hypothetical protein [Cellvibrionales bacterium]
MRYVKPIRKLIESGSRSLLMEVLKPHAPKRSQVDFSTTFPVVFMHGFMGFNPIKLFNFPIVDPFHGASSAIESAGFVTYSPDVDATALVNDRLQMWANEIEKILKTTGAKKIHIIAIGQGAIDARVLACKAMMSCTGPHGESIQGFGFSNKIASITSLGGPHLGTPILENIDTKEVKSAVMDLMDYIAFLNQSKIKNVRQCLENISCDFMQKVFNPVMHIPNDIPCYTVAANPVNEKNTSLLLDETWQYIREIAEYDGGGDNDGLVPIRSALFDGNDTLLAGTQQKQWQVLGQLTTDHFGLAGKRETRQVAVNTNAFYLGLAQNSDLLYRSHTQMSLLTDGNWQRIFHANLPEKKLPPETSSKVTKTKKTLA